MPRQLSSLLLPALWLALVATGCRRADDATVDRTVPAADAPPAAGAPATTQVRVTELRLGRAVGQDRRVTEETDDFRPQDTIHASVVTEGTGTNVTLTARWRYQDGQLVDETSQVISPTGTQVTEFHISRPSGWPAGNYEVEILVNGMRAESEDFEVR
jgi:hypothetical protein